MSSDTSEIGNTETNNEESTAQSQKDKLRAMMDKAKNEYLAKHKDLVDEYLKTNPNANTLDILNHIQSTTKQTYNEGGVSLNCAFMLVIAFVMALILRVQYNFYVEDLLISSVFFSLNPSIDINLLLNDLPLKLDKCEPNISIKGSANKKWMQNNLEYCDFLSMSVNRKLLYIYEHSSAQYKRHSNDLQTLTEWIIDSYTYRNHAKQESKIELMPISGIVSAEHLQLFILSHAEYIQHIWNDYVDKMEKLYAKKTTIAFHDILHRLALELSHYWFVTSLYHNEGTQLEHDMSVNKEIMHAIERYLQYEYFRDGFVCITSKTNKDEHQLVIDFIPTIDFSQIKQYLNLIKDKQMVCVHTFESFGRFNNEIKIYLNVIEQSLSHWTELQRYKDVDTVIIDKYNDIKAKLSELDKQTDVTATPFWRGYEWLKAGGISMDSLVLHDKLIYAPSQKYASLEIFPVDANDDSTIMDIKQYMKQWKALNIEQDALELFYTNSYWFHQYSFEQFATKKVDAQQWAEISEFMHVINTQFGSVSTLIQQMIAYMDQKAVYYNPGFVWILCDSNSNGNNSLYFEHTLRYNMMTDDILSSSDGVIMGFDVWSHSFYNDFVKGYRVKQAEYYKIKKKKFKTKETVGQAIDVQHIGTSLQKTFNYPRSRMEVFGYYIHSLFHNLSWTKIAKRWEQQCRDKGNRRESSQKEKVDNNRENIEFDKRHQEL